MIYVKRFYMTLLEIMIVILIIGFITGVVGYNVKGSLEKGKGFKTKQAALRIKEILSLEMAEGNADSNYIGTQWPTYLKNSAFVKDLDSLKKDAWGNPFVVIYEPTSGDIVVTSSKLDAQGDIIAVPKPNP